ncbi:MAG: hypothetical protein JSW41_01030 [Candidatus Aenigmatarchaeota archaeon]|nr:MAG: hypothetical protein JSW41_01030 [Candidatus Aenigmarchaeota archaeon]
MVHKILDKTYRFFYDNFLSELPEDLAISIGRGLLKLPIEQLPVFEADDLELRTNLGGCELPNPVVMAACYHQPWIIKKASKMGFGAVTLKVTKNPRKGTKPNIVRREEGFVNCVGFENAGMEKTREFLKGYEGVPVILNIAGDSIDEYCEVIEDLQDYTDMIELNISCPNIENGLYFSENPKQARELFREANNVGKKPLIVKLSRGENQEIISHAIDSEIGIVNYANTLPVKEKRLPMGFGGLSGPELYEDTIRIVKKIRKEFGEDLYIIATGGIDSGEKAYRAMESGASAISYVTGFITRGPFLAREINEYLLFRK